MLIPHIAPIYKANSFSCYQCGQYTPHKWATATYHNEENNRNYNLSLEVSICSKCMALAYWEKEVLIHPIQAIIGVLPNNLPKEVKQLYLEALAIIRFSPRAAAALLRMLLDRLSKTIAQQGSMQRKNIFDVVGNITNKHSNKAGFREALDSIRLLNNGITNPSLINEYDNLETVLEIFKAVNDLLKFMQNS